MIRKLSAIAIASVLVFLAVGCGKSEKDYSSKSVAPSASSYTNKEQKFFDVKSFSYKEESKVYESAESGVRKNGFLNKTETPITNREQAIAQAKNENNSDLNYDRTEVFYDSSAKMWKVHFKGSTFEGGDPTIIMNDKGITKYILMGE